MKLSLSAYWRLLRRYLAPQRGAVLWMAVLLLAHTGTQIGGPQLVRRFVDAAVAGSELRALTRIGLILLSIQVVGAVTDILATYWSQRVAWTATNGLRADLAAHLLRLDLDFFQTHPPGELIERVDGDVGALADFFSTLTVGLLGALLLLAGTLGALWAEDAWLALALAACSVLAMGLLAWVKRFGPPHIQAERACEAGFWGYVGEVLGATEDIQRQRSGGLRAAAHDGAPARLAAGGGPRPRVGQLDVVGLHRRRRGGPHPDVRPGRAIRPGRPHDPGHGLYAAHVRGSTALGAAGRDQQPTADPATRRGQHHPRARAAAGDLTPPRRHGPPPRRRAGGRVQRCALCLSPRRRPWRRPQHAGPKSCLRDTALALNGVSFHLPAGRTLGLLGRTGSGKTTIGRLLYRFYDPQQGQVLLGGIELRQARLDPLRARIGLVTQDVQLLNGTLRDNLCFYETRDALPRTADARLLQALERLGLERWLARFPDGLDTPLSSTTLSAGEAQLVALARVTLKDPSLIILDEASSRLDPATEALLGRALDRLLAGRTALIIAHRLSTLARVDEVLILEEGRVVEQGERRALASDPGSRLSQLLRTGLGEVQP